MTVSKSKRIVTFMLCLFLCVMFFVPPQPVDAVLGTATLVAGGWAVGSEVIGSVIAALIMAATGVSFDNGFFGDTDNLSTMAYEQGYKLVQDMIASGGNVSAWLDNAIGLYATTKGFTAGDEIEVPAEVLEYTRTWVNENYDFGDIVSISNQGILTDSGEVILLTDNPDAIGTSFAPIDYTKSDYSFPDIPVIQIGDIQIKVGKYIYRSPDNDYWYSCLTMESNIYQGVIQNSCAFGFSQSSPYGDGDTPDNTIYEKFDSYSDCYCFFVLDTNKSRLNFGFRRPDGNVVHGGYTYLNLSNLGDSFVVADSIITGSDSLSIPQTQDKIIRVPDVPIGSIGGYSVPAMQQLTQDMVISDTVVNPDTPDNPDVVVPDTDAFSVPDTWSGFDAWIKNQAKTITDFTSLIQQKVTGIATDVADFGTSIKEWINEKWGTFTGAFGELKDFVLTIPDILALELEGILADVLEVVNKPVQKLKDKFNETKNKLLPFIKNGFGFGSIWHYVVAWVGSLAPWLSTMFMIWNGLPPAMVIPVYATAVVIIVIGMYRRFFM